MASRSSARLCDQALKSVSASTPKGKTDADFIQEAYGDVLNNQLQMLIDNYIAKKPDSERCLRMGSRSSEGS